MPQKVVAPVSKFRSIIEALEERKFLSTTILTVHTADNGVDSTGALSTVNSTNIRVGDNGSNWSERSAVLPFLLPALPSGAVITGVTANFRLEQVSGGKSLKGAVDVYGLGRRATPTILWNDYYRGGYGGDTTNATAIQASLATSTSKTGAVSLNTVGKANLLSYVKTQYEGGAGANQYVFLRLSHQQEQQKGKYWAFASADHKTASYRPTLMITWELPVQPPQPPLPPPPVVTVNAPAGLGAKTTGSDSINLTWQDQSANESGFVIQRSTDGVIYTTVGTAGANATSYTDTNGLVGDTKYHYRIHAAAGEVTSASTAAVSATTLPVFAATRWVDAGYSGSTATGSYGTPYKSIAAAMSAAQMGDGIVLRGGTYRETVTMKAGVTLMGMPGERAIVSGFADVTGWTLHAGNTYQTTLNWRPTTLYVGFDAMDLSRQPNEGWWPGGMVTQDAVANTTTISDPSRLAGIPSLVGGSVQAHTASGNNWASGTILAHDAVNGTVTLSRVSALATGDYYMVKNTLDLLDRPGEWAVVDNGNGTYTVFFNPQSATDLSATQARKLSSQQIRASNTASNSTIRNLEVTGNTGTGISIGGSAHNHAHNVTVRDVIVHNNGGTGISSRYATGTTIRNSVVIGNGNTGVSVVSTKNGLVDQNEIAFNGNDGVVVAGDISGRATTDPLWDPGDNNTVSNNYIHDHNGFTHSDGIQMYRWPTNTRILNNYITRASQGLMTEQAIGGELSGNVIWNTAAYNVIFGHANTSNWVVRNNTIGGAGYGPFNWDGTNYQVYENVFNSLFTLPTKADFNYQGDRNLFWNNGAAPLRRGSSTSYSTIASWNLATGQDANSHIGDPQFTNAAAVFTVIDGVMNATATSMKVRSVSGFAVGDKIQINGDAVVRTVTGVNTSTRVINWDVALPGSPLTPHVTIENFKASTNFATNLRLKSTSPGATLSSTGGPVGGTLYTLGYVAGDYNNDGLRDIPLVDSGIVAGLPGANGWVPPSF